MKVKRHLSKFNLVEIVLAIGVVALGMAAVLALLPPALRANQDSQGDTDAAEIAANMVTYIDGVVLDCAKNTAEFNKTDTDPANDDTDWCTALEARFEDAAPAENSVEIPSEGDAFTNTLDAPFTQFNVESGSKDKPKWITYVRTDADGNKTPVANVYVWRKKINAEPSNSEPAGIKGIGTGTTVRSCYRFYIKVCWPAEAPADADNRQERTFIHEVIRPVKQ